MFHVRRPALLGLAFLPLKLPAAQPADCRTRMTMRNHPHSALFLVLLCAIFLSQCGGSGTQFIPTPVLTSISPSNTTLLGPGFTLELNGSGFIPTSFVLVASQR